jgi:hypothetical protein
LLLWIATVAMTAGVTGCDVGVTASQQAASGSGTATAAATGGPANTYPSPPPTLAGPRQLTVADNGATVRLRRGQSVTIGLAAQGMFSWHTPVAAGTAVRQVSSDGGYPTDLPARATFLATTSGAATLTATDDTACLHAHPACLPPQQQWQVTIVVG